MVNNTASAVLNLLRDVSLSPWIVRADLVRIVHETDPARQTNDVEAAIESLIAWGLVRQRENQFGDEEISLLAWLAGYQCIPPHFAAEVQCRQS